MAGPAQPDVKEQNIAELFLDSFAGDATTNLYRRFIDSKTRDTDLGAQSVFATMQKDPGFAMMIGFGDVPVSKMNEKDLSDVRMKVIEEFRKVADWKDGSPELRAFNDRVRSRIVETTAQPGKVREFTSGIWFSQFLLGLDQSIDGSGKDRRIPEIRHDEIDSR
jgi:hypothetical protein